MLHLLSQPSAPRLSFLNLLCDPVPVAFPLEASLASFTKGEGLVRCHCYGWNYVPLQNSYVLSSNPSTLERGLIRRRF